MSSNVLIPKDATLCNEINSIGFTVANQGYQYNRYSILKNYSNEAIDAIWESLSINVIENYQRGKGTSIKDFGIFTFKGPEVNLEGTTNENYRDKKPREPVFLVSKEFNREFKIGEYTKQNGIIYYHQKDNKNIPIIRLNIAEIAFSISLPKEEVANILKHYLKYLAETIKNKKFKGKILPGLGVLLVRKNIVAVKFNEEFVRENKFKNRKLNFLKKNLSLDMDMEKAQRTEVNLCTNPYKLFEDLKASNSLYTKCEKSGRDYMNKNLNINFDLLMSKKDNNLNLYKNIFNKKHLKIRINDYKSSKRTNTETKNLKAKNNSSNLGILNILDEEILHDIGYYKGIIIKECKKLDETNTGRITRQDAINALLQSKINEKINEKLAKEIVDYYNDTENVEYMRFIAEMIQDFNKLINTNTNTNFNTIDYNKYKREKFFETSSFRKSINKNDNILKYNLSSYKFNNNNQNRFRKTSKDIAKTLHFLNKSEYKNKLMANDNEKTIENNKNNTTVKKDNIQNNKNSKNDQKEVSEKKDKSINNSNKNINEEDDINKTNENFFSKREKETEDMKPKLSRMISILPDLKRKYFTSLDQKISCNEFMRIIIKYDLYYPKNDILNLLKFIGVENNDCFSLKEFISSVNKCKILQTSVNLKEFNKIFKKIKDIIYINGGSQFLFNNSMNNSSTIDCSTFVKILKEKTKLNEEILIYVFRYLVKTDREFDINDYINYFDNPRDKVVFDEPYFIKMMKEIINKVYSMQFKPEDYFNHLISFNTSTEDKVLTKLNWIKYIQNDNLPFSAEELDNLFNWMDTKKDNILDIDEFVNGYNFCLRPLTLLKDIILTNKLDIEDLAHRMKIDINEIEKLDYDNFAKKIKRLDYTLPNEFIKKLFIDLCKIKEKDNKNNNNNKDNENNSNINNSKKGKNNENLKTIDSKFFLDEINYVKPVTEYRSFNQNYLDVIKSKISYQELKQRFEKYDEDSLGNLTRIQYIMSIQDILPEFTDEDHMRFIRINNVFDKEGKIIYPELLNIIYYFNKSKLSDPFTLLCQTFIEILEEKCNNDIEVLMNLIETGIPKKKFSLIAHKPLTCYQVKKYINTLNLKIDIPIKIIQKLDIDADGLISIEDLKAVLKRYSGTLYFKYGNDSTNPNIKLFSKETMNEKKIKTICVKIQSYMKSKNINPHILFKKFDKDNDGLISNTDFNQGISEIFHMSPALGDPFFNYLDFYHIGMIDPETFMARINKFVTTHAIVQNNNKIEKEIIDKLKNFIKENKNLSDTEIFQVMDKDCDGLISIKDLEYFVKNNLTIHEKAFDKSKLERVMMSLSLSKNLQIGLNDIREFMDKCNENQHHMNLKEIFKLTTNQNLSDLKKNVDWTNDIIERFGMFISEKYDSIEQFFNENSEPRSNKFKFSDFLNFHEKNYELFNNGFNLTKDELLSIYTSLDSQKKNYLTLQDIKNKLHIFNFYTKMHIDVKNFLKDNFNNSIDAFKFFVGKRINPEKNEPNFMDPEEASKCSITLKEFFDAFNFFFPNKYANNTKLKYLNKYFNITLPSGNDKTNLINKKDTISFSEFNYIYFDKVETDQTFLNKRENMSKLVTNRKDIEEKIESKNLRKDTEDNYYYSHLFKKKFETLSTPFDNDPLLKLKRILCSSKYDLNSFFETISMKCPNDNFIVNKYQFKHIIKELDLGLTNLELEQIHQKIDKVSYDGNVNLRNFVKYLFNQNPTLKQGKENIARFIEEIKSLIYKYYSNPIICFQNNDKNHMGKIDFGQFKNIIFDMFYRNEQNLPNFTLLKNAFDACDLRKDGIIDINEWCKAFATYNAKLDPYPKKSNLDLEFYDTKFNSSNNFKLKSNIDHNRRVLRDWETSGDISKLYKLINKNRKYIKNKIIELDSLIKTETGNFIEPDNLIKAIQVTFPNLVLSKTQWKMIVNIGRSKKLDNLVDLDEFFRLTEITSMNLESPPIIELSNKNMMHKMSNSVNFNTNHRKTDTNTLNKSNLINSFKDLYPKDLKRNQLSSNSNDNYLLKSVK